MSKTQSSLAAFRGTNYAGIPWLAKIEPNTICEFLIKLSSIEPIVSKTPWGDQNEADALMKGLNKKGDLIDEEGDQWAEQGIHRLPFWTCDGLQTVISEHETNDGDMDGWIQVAYKREVSTGRNRDGKKVDINDAIWALFIEEA